MLSNNMVVVVGAEESGKTSLLSAMSCKCPTAYGEKGGSEWYYIGIPFEGEIYPFSVLEMKEVGKWSEVCIRTAACVLLLIDSLSIASQNKALRLLQKVKDLKGNMTIAIVNTKCDDGRVLTVRSSKLYPYVSTSIKTRLGIEELQRVLLAAVYPNALKKRNMFMRFFSLVQAKSKSTKTAEYGRSMSSSF